MKFLRNAMRVGWWGGFACLELSGIVFAQIPPAAAPAPAASSATAAPAVSADTSGTGTIPELHVGKDVYYDVRVLKVTPTSVVIAHRDGIGSIPLADLPSDLQKKFGYNPTAASADEARLRAANQANIIQESAAAGRKQPALFTAQQILDSFGQPPKIYAEVNMQPRFDHLGIGVKNHNPSPSSAIAAMVAALEYQNSTADGPAPEYSEEYLLWATLRLLGKKGIEVPKDAPPTLDLGFKLREVADAVRNSGVALADDLPYHFTLADPKVVEPTPEVIERAKTRIPANGYSIEGQTPAARLGNILQVLDAGVPVVVAMRWPEEKTGGDDVSLDAQTAPDDSSHVVLLVGYRSKAGKLDDVVFLFKNCYGTDWGEHGYGIVSGSYLAKNLPDAFFLDVS